MDILDYAVMISAVTMWAVFGFLYFKGGDGNGKRLGR